MGVVGSIKRLLVLFVWVTTTWLVTINLTGCPHCPFYDGVYNGSRLGVHYQVELVHQDFNHFTANLTFTQVTGISLTCKNCAFDFYSTQYSCYKCGGEIDCLLRLLAYGNMAPGDYLNMYVEDLCGTYYMAGAVGPTVELYNAP
ncbi:hypothetical protein FOL47_008877 [Perkinsus chesapeaki]|uniref:Uncharacterized protein n=1 Tax=Perkinsus chesapeaki TaxID=330153 RepID=A0A7J6LBC9_PERCH|nr:hypothetical protein FOL47_008877 [Perkinsus chesapeaki]